MSSAGKQLVLKHLEELEQTKGMLVDTVNTQVDKIAETTKTWLANSHNEITAVDLSAFLTKTSHFLLEKTDAMTEMPQLGGNGEAATSEERPEQRPSVDAATFEKLTEKVAALESSFAEHTSKQREEMKVFDKKTDGLTDKLSNVECGIAERIEQQGTALSDRLRVLEDQLLNQARLFDDRLKAELGNSHIRYDEKLTECKVEMRHKDKILLKRIGKLETKLTSSNMMWGENVLHLIELRDILNKKITDRPLLCDRITAVENQLSQLATLQSPLPVMVSAVLSSTIAPQKDQTLNQLSNVDLDIGGHFDRASGVFTSPLNGTALVFLSLGVRGRGMVRVDVIHQAYSGGQGEKVVCTLVVRCDSGVYVMTDTNVGVVPLSTRDKLFAKVGGVDGEIMLWKQNTRLCCVVLP